MLKKVSIGLAVVLALFLTYVAFQSPEFRVQREITIQAPPEAIFPYLNNTRTMNTWNPFVKMDPGIQLSYEGPEAGVGAVSSWEGKKAGVGRSIVTESVPNSLVRSSLEFKEPMEGTQVVEFALKPEGDQTTVVWTAVGRSNFLGRVICVFMNMQGMMGDTFDQGLADLKRMVEQART